MISHEKSEEYFDNFVWAVPLAFADALGTCRFERGDTLYNTKKAYERTWGEAINHIAYSIQVKSPSRTTVARTEGKEKSVFTTNWEQKVVFDLTDYMKNKTREITTTQGRLYTLLWRGDLKYLEEETDAPPVPTLASGILKDIKKAVSYFRKTVTKGIKHGVMFLMPYDRSLLLYRTKFAKVKAGLEKVKTTTEIATLKEAGFISETKFAPTVKIVCFCVDDISVSEINEILKDALYTQPKNKKSETKQFGIHRHGLLEIL
ncbi:MAG: hypothetical protein WC454_08950 [Phycisphaerae bacterium]|jgi:hypothetical protein